MAKNMEAPFVFGVRVEGDAFTDRREETERLKANFGSPDKLGGKILNFPEKVIPLCHE